MFKDRTIIILLVISLSLLFYERLKTQDVTVVFNETEEPVESTYLIDLTNEYITTKDINNFKVIEAVLPYVEDKYKDIIREEWYYFDKNKSNEYNTLKLEEKYKNIFQKNALKLENININYYGVRIKKIRLTTTNISEYRNYKYEQLKPSSI